jgi:hypothetical protein
VTSGDRGFRARARALPLWARLLLGTVVLAAVGAAVHGVASVLLPDYDRSLLEDVLQLAVTGVVIGLITRWAGGYEASSAAQKAIRRRSIPEDADRNLVRRGLEGFRRANLRLRWWVAGLLGLTAVAVAVVSVLHGTALGWVVVAALVVLGAGYWLLLRNRLRRVDALLAELDRREGAQP